MDFEYDVMGSVDVFCNTEIDDIIDKANQIEEFDTPPTPNDSIVERLIKPNKQTKRRSKRNKTKSSLKNSTNQNGLESQPEKSVEPEISHEIDETTINNELDETPMVSCSTSQRGKARRRFLSELANTLTSVDNCNLTVQTLEEENAGTSARSRKQRQRNNRRQQNAPQQQINSNVICIGSDDDDADVIYEPIRINNPDSQLNTRYSNLDIENPEYSIKIEWLNKIEAFPLRKYQKFYNIFEILSKRENADIKDIILNTNSKIITPNDTPNSINYLCLDIISGRVVENSKVATGTKKIDKNLVSVKLQSNAWKGHIQISIKKTDTFKILYIKCSEELKLPFEKFNLQFDGDMLSMSDTPNDLSFEDGEIIDCVIKK